jgi:hypothetical protein
MYAAALGLWRTNLPTPFGTDWGRLRVYLAIGVRKTVQRAYIFFWVRSQRSGRSASQLGRAVNAHPGSASPQLPHGSQMETVPLFATAEAVMRLVPLIAMLLVNGTVICKGMLTPSP